MRVKNLFKMNAKRGMLLAAGLVFVVFTAAYQKRKPKGYHSAAEMQNYRHVIGDLPTGSSDMFMGSGRCAGCHGVDQDISNPPLALVNSEGVNVSPAENWRATMMANSSKDPVWRAKLVHETLVNPGHAGELTNKCTSCHAPLGRFEAAHDGVEYFTTEMLDADSLARDGVSCMACHSQQIETTLQCRHCLGAHFQYTQERVASSRFYHGQLCRRSTCSKCPFFEV
jgi:hypothetical protein